MRGEKKMALGRGNMEGNDITPVGSREENEISEQPHVFTEEEEEFFAAHGITGSAEKEIIFKRALVLQFAELKSRTKDDEKKGGGLLSRILGERPKAWGPPE